MTTSAINEKFAAVNAGLTHLYWMASNLDDVNMNDCGHDWYRASLASMARSMELLFKSIHDDYYALHELLVATYTSSAFSGLMLDGESRVFELEEVMTALGVLAAQSGNDDHTVQKCISAAGAGILAREKALRKHMSAMAKAWKGADRLVAELPAANNSASVPEAKPQRSQSRVHSAEAVAA